MTKMIKHLAYITVIELSWGREEIFDVLLANQLSKMPGRSSTTAKVVRDANYRSEKQVKRSNTALNRVHAVLSRNAFSRCCEE